VSRSATVVYCRFCCRACGSHFTSLEAFDAHRVGSHAANTRTCVDPAIVATASRMLEVFGTCRIANGRDHPRRRISVWMLERHQNPALARETRREAA
jgi:hypothetical protein